MSTIKHIAELTKLSVGTVSLVLNGRGDELRISKETQQRILDAAQTIGYLPNVSARRLRRFSGRNLPAIATFWPSDLAPELLGRFYVGAQSSILTQECECEMTVHSFQRHDIHRIREVCEEGIYHGAIISGMTTEEQRELEAEPLNVPMVLFNRYSEIFSCTYINSYEIGRKIAELFKLRGHRRVGTIVPHYLVQAAGDQRYRGFVESCEAYGLELDERHIITASHTMEGGNQAAHKLAASGGPLPTAMFFPLGIMAIAALPVFHRAGIRIPEQMEIMTYGNHDVEKYSVPSLSTVQLPVEEMSAACVRLVLQQIVAPKSKPTALLFETPFIFRESCGGFQSEG